ncbi:peptide/nickel transport system substrate-binding protein [Gracilibacillus halotolerans]|uniref:Peptide/nickel transport system substrate-binding protein n=1 Tax=Gracilibacillus halotolerans TaxID=74386 RepID=A0A841RMK2_9BACI|nr:ABC transporter substrate-binding protein [Gracilibacillus halotolerans]MBB6512154.1 peptide/nickel transport system substrate-binding protein [Gracilibacillus halotolerans]
MKRYYFILLILSVLLLGCNAKGEEMTTNGQPDHLVLAIGSEPEQGFDPTTGWGSYGSPLFQSTLLRLDENLQIQYDLATEYTISEDGRIWTVTLRQDAYFSNGEALTAEDVVFTFDLAKTKQSIVDVSNVEKIEKTNDYEVVFYLKEPQSTFITLLQTLGIVPKHAYSDEYASNPIGSGPYQLIEWRKNEQLIVEVNPHYYGKAPLFERLTFLFMEPDQALAAAKTGVIDVLSVPATYPKEDIAGMERLSLASVDNRGIMLPFVSPTINSDGVQIGHEVTSNEEIRKAMNLAVHRQELVDTVMNGEGTPAYSSADRLPWFHEENIMNDNDKVAAEELLLSNGWSKGDDGIFQKESLRASMMLYYPAGDQLRQSLALLVAQQLKEIGLEIVPKGASWNDIEEVMHKEAVLMGWGSHNPIELFNLYHSGMAGMDYYNANYYQNEKVDEYMEKAIQSTNLEDAYEYWKLAQWDGTTGFSGKADAPWVWLVNVNHIYYVKEPLQIGEQKIQPHGHGWPITDFIMEWTWEE